MKRNAAAVGLIGLGIMGSAMAANLIRAGYRIVGYDVLASRRRRHRSAGGDVAENAREVGRRTRFVICSLPSAGALLETARELTAASPSGQIVIETSTLPIPVKEEARKILQAGGAILLDCPLSGTGAQARVKDLVVFASGDRRACQRVAPIFDAVARAHYYVGPFAAGSRMKFVANLLVAIHNVAAAEALVLAMKAGLDPALTCQVMADGAGSSRMLQVRGPMMVKGKYSNPSMKLDVWQKDMAIIAEFARQLQCPTPLFATTAPIYSEAVEKGWGSEDTGAVCAVLEERAGVRRKP